jgi:hypothetical protein
MHEPARRFGGSRQPLCLVGRGGADEVALRRCVRKHVAIVDGAPASYDVTVPFRKTLIVGLIALAVLGYAGSRHFDDEEPSLIDLIGRGDVTFDVPPTVVLPDRNPPYLAGVDPIVSPVVPVTPPTINVSNDPAGRPYDVLLERGAKVERRPFAKLHAPTRKVLIMGGEETANVRPGTYRPVLLAERPRRKYRVDAIWVREKGDAEKIVGVVIVERDSHVVRWRQVAARAYTTTEGYGGITTVEWSALPKGVDNPVESAYWDRLREQRREAVTADGDGHAGVDTVIFRTRNGWGSFPSFAGFDAAGNRAQTVLWSMVVPWRLAFPTGTPPARITRRENQLRSCLKGRTLDGYRCQLVR